MKKAIVLGAGGFIGSHLVKRLKTENYFVIGVDLKYPEFSKTAADEFIIGDLRDPDFVASCIDVEADEVYQLAADMGGAGYIFSGENDASVMHNSALINLNVVKEAVRKNIRKIFYASSACIYPKFNQEDPDNPICSEDSAYPAFPDSEYGWEKLFSERLFNSHHRNFGLNIRIARFHNVYGPEGVWDGGKEKAPAALCRKAAEAKDGGQIEVWGDGLQTRSFLFIDDCIEGIRLLMASEFSEPMNIGSEEMISIREYTEMIINLSGKSLTIKNIPGPEGVRGRKSDNRLVNKVTGWIPKYSLLEGTTITYSWIAKEVEKAQTAKVPG
ncbi:MAG: NAD-dependent epimerase/dehydratase family protein [Bacteroidota bacterium]